MRIWLLIITLVMSNLLMGQYPYQIEKEEIHYKFNSGKTNYDNYVPLTTVQIECTRHLKILTEKGAADWSSIELPEAIDPIYRDIVAQHRIRPFYLNNYSVDEIEITIVRHGKHIRIDTENKEVAEILQRRVLEKSYLTKNATYIPVGVMTLNRYKLIPLRVDDVIIMKYKLSIPYSGNAHELGSFRIFFHGVVPKKDVTIRISKSEAAQAIFTYQNGAEPHSSFQSDMIMDKWKFDELPAALSDVNGRPHLKLPHVVVITHFRNFNNCSLISDNKSDAYKTSYHRICSSRQYRFIQNRIAVDIGSTYEQHKTLAAFTNELCANAEGLDLIRAPFNHIANTFTYSTALYSGIIEENFGDDLKAKTIRDVNRLETYAAILDQLRTSYVLATPIDKRIGQLSNQYIRPYYTSDPIFSVITNSGQFLHIVPKTRNCGYYVDELPFYFEGSPMAITYSEFHSFAGEDIERTFGTRHQGWHIDRPMTTAPSSTSSDNSRNTTLQCSIDIEKNEAAVKGRTSLSGQFSTICRGLYLCDEKMPYVDEQYNQKIWETISTFSNARFEVTDTNTLFPFETKIKYEFDAKPIHKTKADEFTLDLSGWINHIDISVDTANRILDYYSDFLLADRFSFQIQINENVSFIDLPEDISIQNGFGTYQLKVKAEASSLLIYSNLIIKEEKVESKNIREVYELYSAIQQAEGLRLTIKRT
ncbi:MAG: hypothetical protein R2813_07300 [Flavobacteriales bacterium]